MAKKMKTKKIGAAKPSAKRKATRSGSRGGVSKYDQPGAPWWRRVAMPQSKQS